VTFASVVQGFLEIAKDPLPEDNVQILFVVLQVLTPLHFHVSVLDDALTAVQMTVYEL